MKNTMKKILIINGSYRENGITDQMTKQAEQVLTEAGHEVEVILLRAFPIQFCLNCRQCTQQAGKIAGDCVHDDNMSVLIGHITASDAFVLAAPTNFSSVTAIFKRFMERLVVFGEWTWGQPAPTMRLATDKKALLLSSCAAPALLARWQFDTIKQLKLTARVMGAKPVGSVVAGRTAQQSNAELTEKIKKDIRRLTKKLIEED